MKAAHAAKEDPEVKEEEERRIKKTQNYKLQASKFVNLCDKDGKSPLHYAIIKSNFQVAQMLVKYDAIPIIRDHKNRVNLLL